jgi:hypothetical protein
MYPCLAGAFHEAPLLFPGDFNQASDFEALDKFLIQLNQNSQNNGNRIITYGCLCFIHE